MTEIITRAEAKARGLKRYFTGKSCKRGHVCERYVDRRKCVLCGNELSKRWKEKTGYYQNNRDKYKLYISEWMRKNPEKHREYVRNYKLNGPKNPRSELQWLRKNEAQLRTVKRLLKNLPEVLSKRKKVSMTAFNLPT